LRSDATEAVPAQLALAAVTVAGGASGSGEGELPPLTEEEATEEEVEWLPWVSEEAAESSVLTQTLSLRFLGFLAGGGLQEEAAADDLPSACARETPCWSSSMVSASRAASRLSESRSMSRSRSVSLCNTLLVSPVLPLGEALREPLPAPGNLDMAPDAEVVDEHVGDVSADVSEPLCAPLREDAFFTPYEER